MSTLEQFDHAAGVVDRLLELGADVSALDSAGNPALMRAVLDAKQIWREPVQPELVAELHRVFGMLSNAGADPGWVDPRFGIPIVEYIESHAVRQFLP